MTNLKFTAQDFLNRIKNLKRTGDSNRQWMGECPCGGHQHGDREQSLSIHLAEDGRILCDCKVGHSYFDVLDALGIDRGDMTRGNSPRRPRQKPTHGTRSKLAPTVEPATSESLEAKSVRHRQSVEHGGRLEKLAERLGVSPDSLRRFHAGYCARDTDEFSGNSSKVWPEHFTFPERSPSGDYRSLQRRILNQGAKDEQRTPPGQRRGLFYPDDLVEMPGDLILSPEGVSDSAAGDTLGIPCIGRPGCNSGGEDVAELVTRAALVGQKKLVIFGDNDPGKGNLYPGQDGAKKQAQVAANRLNYPVSWALPPKDYKDLRHFLNANLKDVDNHAELSRLREQLLDHVQNNATEVFPDGIPQEVGNCSINTEHHLHCQIYEEPINNTNKKSNSQLLEMPPCHYGVLLRNRKNGRHERISYLNCWTWKCQTCRKKLKARWAEHLRGIMEATGGGFYILRITEDQWKSCYNTIVKKGGKHFRINTCDGKVLVFSTASYKKFVAWPAAMAIQEMATAVDDLPPCRKAISTCREWKLPREDPATGEWERVSNVSRIEPEFVIEQLKAKGIKPVKRRPVQAGKLILHLEWMWHPDTPEEEISRFNCAITEKALWNKFDAGFDPSEGRRRKEAG